MVAASYSFAPLAATSAIFGIWPYPLHSPRVVHRWPTLVNLIFTGSVLVWFVSEGQLDISELTHPTTTIDYAYVLCHAQLFLMPWMNAVVFVFTWKDVNRVLLKLGTLDIPVEESAMRRVSWKAVAFSLVDAAVCSTFFSYYKHLRGSRVYVCNALLMFQAIAIRDLIPGHLVYFSVGIARRFGHLNESIRSECLLPYCSWGEKLQPTVRMGFSKITLLYFELCEFVEQVSETYGLVMCITFAYFILELVSILFLVLHLWEELTIPMKIFSVVSWSCRLMLVYYMTSLVGSIAEEATKSLKYLVSARSITQDCHVQVQALIQKMTGPPIHLTAGNFFAIQRGILTSVVGASITNFIVLLQFKEPDNAKQMT